MREIGLCCLIVIGCASPALAQARELLDRYASGDYAAVDAGLVRLPDLPQFFTDLQRTAGVWVNQDGVDRAPRRRLIAASVALEAAGARLESWPTGQALVEWGCQQLREGPPIEAERVWHLAATALIQRSYAATTDHPPSHAMSRFPDEDRFRLALAIAVETATWPDRKGRPLDDLRSLVKALEPLLASRSIRAEVHLRLGHTHLRLGQRDRALEHFGQVEPLTNDPFLRYLSRYFTGRARREAGDRGAAINAYRAALQIVPHAESAAIALAALAFTSGARQDAFAAIDGALAGRDPVDDPWRLYYMGDFRFWRDFVDLLRKELR